MRGTLHLMFVLVVITTLIYFSARMDPSGTGEGGFRDIRIPRAPASSSNIPNPLPHAPEVIAQGETIYQGKGTCFVCHGVTGKGDGPAGLELRPPPRDFTSPQFQDLRTDGELFWVIRNGSTGTRMFSYSPSVITEEEAWMVIHYLRSLEQTAPVTPG